MEVVPPGLGLAFLPPRCSPGCRCRCRGRREAAGPGPGQGLAGGSGGGAPRPALCGKRHRPLQREGSGVPWGDGWKLPGLSFFAALQARHESKLVVITCCYYYDAGILCQEIQLQFCYRKLTASVSATKQCHCVPTLNARFSIWKHQNISHISTA